jgi:hypothetical protein
MLDVAVDRPNIEQLFVAERQAELVVSCGSPSRSAATDCGPQYAIKCIYPTPYYCITKADMYLLTVSHDTEVRQEDNPRTISLLDVLCIPEGDGRSPAVQGIKCSSVSLEFASSLGK